MNLSPVIAVLFLAGTTTAQTVLSQPRCSSVENNACENESPHVCCVTLTPNATNRRGFAFGDTTFDVTKSFEFEGKIFLGNADENGADGIAAFFTPRTDFSFNPWTADIHGIYAGLPFEKFFAVEFDTWYNTQYSNDISSDHLQLLKAGSGYTPEYISEPVPVQNLEDNALHDLYLNWNNATQTFVVKLDGEEKIKQTDINLEEILEDSTAYFGFSATTGALGNTQYVCDTTCFTTPPSSAPTTTPSFAPTTTTTPSSAPTTTPSAAPTTTPSSAPTTTTTPSSAPTATPSYAPTTTPSSVPTTSPTSTPTITTTPSFAPTITPSFAPTTSHSSAPTITTTPSSAPTTTPSSVPTTSHSSAPTITTTPSSAPTTTPSSAPTTTPTSAPTTTTPSSAPTTSPTYAPTTTPTSAPTTTPTSAPTTTTTTPSSAPTSTPTSAPTTKTTSVSTPTPTVSPFSWEIDPFGNWTATFDDNSAGNELKGKYKMTVGRHYDFKVLQSDCKNQIGVVDAIKYVQPITPLVPATGVVEASIGISMDRLSDIKDKEVYFENFKDGIDKIKICIKGSLLVSGTDDTSVNFHETILTILVDKAQDFIIDIETERTAATNTTDNVTVAYKVDPFICAGGELSNPSTWVASDSDYSQGDVLKVCLKAANTADVYMEKVTKFQLEQVSGGTEDKSVMIGDNNEAIAGGILADSECFGKLCMIQSMIPAKYFDDINATAGSPYNLKGSGEIVLQFGSASDERRLQGILGDSFSTTGASSATIRGLQSVESTPSSSFEVSVGLKGENIVEDDGREVSSAERLPMYLSFAGAFFITGVALLN